MEAPQPSTMQASAMTATNGTPLWLLAELTYRCPLHCVYCYNPVDFALTERELATDDWVRVLREARALGSVQCGFSGGEPMMREDLEVLVAEAHRLGYYTNLLTSGVGLTEETSGITRMRTRPSGVMRGVTWRITPTVRRIWDCVTRPVAVVFVSWAVGLHVVALLRPEYATAPPSTSAGRARGTGQL